METRSDLLPDLAEARREFLSSGDEDRLPIVDAHHHFWDLRNPHPWLTQAPRIPFRYGDYAAICKNFLPEDYARACGAHRVLRHVTMEGEWSPDDPLGEARWMSSLAQRCGKPQALAAQIWLDRDDAESLMRAYTEPPLRGFIPSVRHKPRSVRREEYSSCWNVPGSMRCPAWRRGYALLADYGLMFELQAPWWHMAEAAELARDFPATTIIINHAGLPAVRDAETLRQWRAAMAPLASCANVRVKISGLGVRATQWTPAQQAPVVDALIADFGVDRCLFASNYPVDALVARLVDIWQGFKTLTRRFSPRQRLALFCDNALDLYGLH